MELSYNFLTRELVALTGLRIGHTRLDSLFSLQVNHFEFFLRDFYLRCKVTLVRKSCYFCVTFIPLEDVYKIWLSARLLNSERLTYRIHRFKYGKMGPIFAVSWDIQWFE